MITYAGRGIELAFSDSVRLDRAGIIESRMLARCRSQRSTSSSCFVSAASARRRRRSLLTANPLPTMMAKGRAQMVMVNIPRAMLVCGYERERNVLLK